MSTHGPCLMNETSDWCPVYTFSSVETHGTDGSSAKDCCVFVSDKKSDDVLGELGGFFKSEDGKEGMFLSV